MSNKLFLGSVQTLVRLERTPISHRGAARAGSGEQPNATWLKKSYLSSPFSKQIPAGFCAAGSVEEKLLRPPACRFKS